MKTIINSSIKDDALLLTVTRGIEGVDINTIVRIEASSNYSKIYFANGQKLVSSKVLRWFEEHLPDQLFVRIHRTHIVNKKFIRTYIYNSGKIALANGESIQVSRRKKEVFLKCWHNAAA